jgi:hypothetical protein
MSDFPQSITLQHISKVFYYQMHRIKMISFIVSLPIIVNFAQLRAKCLEAQLALLG